MSLYIPKQRLYECSAVLREGFEQNNITLDAQPHLVLELGSYVLGRMLPELGLMLTQDVAVASDGAVQAHDGERRSFVSAEFVGRFSAINISQVERPEHIEDFGDITIEQTDAVLVFQQRIRDGRCHLVTTKFIDVADMI